MPQNWYDGSAAYKLDEYYGYTAKHEKKEEEQKAEKAKTSSVNYKKVFALLGIIFVVGIAFLYTNVLLIQASTKHDQLNAQLEELKVRNTQMSFDITSGIDLELVEQKALTEYGMHYPESYQNVYVNVVQSDYTETFSVSHNKDVMHTMADYLKDFLNYID